MTDNEGNQRPGIDLIGSEIFLTPKGEGRRLLLAIGRQELVDTLNKEFVAVVAISGDFEGNCMVVYEPEGEIFAFSLYDNNYLRIGSPVRELRSKFVTSK